MNEEIFSTGSQQEMITNFLASYTFFNVLDKEIIRTIATEIESIKIRSGTELIKQGTPGDSLFIVINGCLRIFISKPTDGSTVIRELGRGEVVGEMSLLVNEPRSASVLAIRDTELIKFSKDAFERLLEIYPHMMLQLLRVIVKRCGQWVVQALSQIYRQFRILPIGVNEAFSIFSRNLLDALAQWGSTFSVTSKVLDSVFGDGTAHAGYDNCNDSKILGWLYEQERKNDFLIYEADPINTPWTERCIRQADCILIVCLASSEPGVSQLEMELLNKPPENFLVRRELVLLHTNKYHSPYNTNKWLKNGDFQEHYHIDVNSKADYNYLARRLTGRSYGLARRWWSKRICRNWSAPCFKRSSNPH